MIMNNVNWEACSELNNRIHWRALRKHLMNTKSLLDFGCGIGRWAPPVKRMNIHYSGIDTSPGMIRAAQQLHTRLHAKFEHFNGLEIPFPDSSFDVVLSSLVFIYILKTPSCATVLSEIRRVLKPDGRFILIEQASLSNQKSGSASHVLLESDYVSALTLNQFHVRQLYRVRRSTFSTLTQWCLNRAGLLRGGEIPQSILPFLSGSLARFESWQLSRRANSYFIEAPYYEFLLEATLIN
jgi:ubiquinone/menaquinone biosynthesis C-methylase UbiE